MAFEISVKVFKSISLSYLNTPKRLIQQHLKICFPQENLHASFSPRKRLILAPRPWFHGNSDIVTACCLSPTPLCCSGSPLESALSHCCNSASRGTLTFSDWVTFFSPCHCVLK